MAEKPNYSKGESVIYPSHGVGEVIGTETMELAGTNVEMMVIKFEHERMTLRLPVSQLEDSGLRRVASKNKMDTALKALKGKSRNKPTMWARRAQEYENKINSGDPVAVAEVLRDLFRRDDQPEQSYSERQLYQSALGRLAHELAIVDHTDSEKAIRRVEEMLGKVFEVHQIKPEADTVPEPAKPAETKPEPKPEVKAKPKAPVKAKVAVKAKAKVKAKPAVKAKAKAKVKAKAKPAVKAKAKAKVKAKPAVKAKVKAKPVQKAKKAVAKKKSPRKA